MFNRRLKSLTGLATMAAVPLAVAISPGATAAAADITNPAQHPYAVTVTIGGETYHDGLDTLPGYDDYSCTAIPDVVYDFGDNQILYYDDQGDLLAVAPWTEWSRISSYKTWLAQQQAGSGSGSSTTPTTTTTAGSGSSGTGPGSAGGSSSSSGSTSTGASSSATTSNLLNVTGLAGAVAKAPTSKTVGSYRVKISTPSGKAAASGQVTLKLRHGKNVKTVTAKASGGTAAVVLPKLAKGSWNVAISFAGSAIYRGHVAVGASIKVAR